MYSIQLLFPGSIINYYSKSPSPEVVESGYVALSLLFSEALEATTTPLGTSIVPLPWPFSCNALFANEMGQQNPNANALHLAYSENVIVLHTKDLTMYSAISLGCPSRSSRTPEDFSVYCFIRRNYVILQQCCSW